jgi:hypothetical protein
MRTFWEFAKELIQQHFVERRGLGTEGAARKHTTESGD